MNMFEKSESIKAGLRQGFEGFSFLLWKSAFVSLL